MTRSSGSEKWSFTIFHIYRRAVINKQANDFRVAPTGSERERTVAREVVPPLDLADIWVNAGAKRSSNRTYVLPVDRSKQRLADGKRNCQGD